MILYEYHCPACGERLEIRLPLPPHPEIDCPHCSQTMERSYSPAYIKDAMVVPKHNKNPFKAKPEGWKPGRAAHAYV